MKGIYKVCNGTSASGKKYNPATERNPDAKGNNKSRTGFTFCCYSHHLGKHFQNVVKISIREAVTMFHSKYYNPEEIGEDLRELHECLNKSVKSRIGNDPGGEYKEYFMLQFVDMLVYYIQRPDKLEELYTNNILNSLISKSHTWIQKYYDKGAYTYEDQRLVEISGVLKNEITVYFNSSQTLLDIVDIIVFLMKEDIYYRARWIPILQDIRENVFETAKNNRLVLLVSLCKLCETCKDYQLSAVEKENVQRWH